MIHEKASYVLHWDVAFSYINEDNNKDETELHQQNG